MRFSVTSLPYAQTPSIGPDHVLHRLSAGEVPEFPLTTGTGEAVPDSAETAYVVAGQQPCLLTGPLYTVLKAATAIGLARDLAEASGRPVRPLFWVASEDHDILEVNRVTINGRKLVCPYRGELKRGHVPPVSEISLKEDRSTIVGFLQDVLPQNEFREEVVRLVAGCRFDSYGTLFADLLAALFEPWQLAVVEPVSLRETTSPVLARVVERWPDAVAAFRIGAERVRELGFIPPLSSLSFFEIVGGKRVPVVAAGGSFVLSSGTVSSSEAAEIIRRAPGRFSPGAALRPVLQDAAFPVAVTVAGPTEILYVWQVRELYDVAGVRPSHLFPRISATFVEKKIERKLAQAGVGLADVLSVRDRLSQLSAAIDRVADPASDAVAASGRALLEALAQATRPRNQRWLERTIRTVGGMVDKTVGRLRSEAQEERGMNLGALRAVADAVLPRGEPQDRVASVFDFVGRYGSAWLRALCGDVDPWVLYHQIVTFTM